MEHRNISSSVKNLTSFLGGRLLLLRKYNGKKQEAVGRALGVSDSTICSWETGRSTPNWMSLHEAEFVTSPISTPLSLHQKGVVPHFVFL
jgi:DNA-binding XRE family transcriptional regulator